MTAVAPRTANGTPDLRRVAVAVGALTLTVALVVAVAFIRPAGGPSASTSGQAKDLAANGTIGGYTGIPYTPTRPAPKALPGLHGSRSGATPNDMSSAAYAAQQAALAIAANRELDAAIFAAQQQAAGFMSSDAYAALHPAAAPTISSRTDMSSAAYAAMYPAPATTATHIDMTSAAYLNHRAR